MVLINKIVNQNKVLSVFFLIVAIIYAFVSNTYLLVDSIFSYDSISFIEDFVSMIVEIASPTILILGILRTNRSYLMTGQIMISALIFLNILFYVIEEGLYFYIDLSVGRILNILMLIFVATIFLFSAFYTSGIVEKKNVAGLILASFLSVHIYFYWSLVIAALLILLIYPDISDIKKKVKTSDVLVLSLATFGIYYLLWIYSVIKKVNTLLGKEKTFSMTLFYTLLYPYRLYWYYVNYEELSEKRENVKNRGIITLSLSAFLCDVVSLAIVQRDLNFISEELKEEESPLEEEMPEETEENIFEENPCCEEK